MHVKTTLIFFLFSFMFTTSFAQNETMAYKTVSKTFESNYNVGNYEAVFDMFDPEMKKALPLGKTIEFLSNLKTQVGQINKMQFIKFVNGTYAVYKTNFDRALFALHISLDNKDKINGLFVKPFTDESQPMIKRNSTKLILPFTDEWTVIWGGDTKELNYHVESMAQKNAFDMLITDSNGKSYKTDGKTNEDYYAFGKELFAPCDGEVVLVVDGVKDNTPGEMNTFNVGGNMVILKTPKNEFLVFCHFKHQSIHVKEGQKLKQGELLGRCGNTGNSSEAHLHFHIQNIENQNSATGVKCYFEKIRVNGQVKEDYSPIKNDKVKRN